MPDYGKLSDEELNREIWRRMHPEQRMIPWAIPRYVNDKAATWDALVEMPDVSLEVLAGAAGGGQWYIGYSRPTGCADATSAARAVWLAWLAWMDGKQDNPDAVDTREEDTMSDSDNLTLATFTARVRLDGRSALWMRAAAIDVIYQMWELMEAQKQALTRAMRENRIHAEALEIAMDGLPMGGYFIEQVNAKLAELEGSPDTDHTAGG